MVADVFIVSFEHISRFSSVFIADFEQSNFSWDQVPLNGKK